MATRFPCSCGRDRVWSDVAWSHEGVFVVSLSLTNRQKCSDEDLLKEQRSNRFHHVWFETPKRIAVLSFSRSLWKWWQHLCQLKREVSTGAISGNGNTHLRWWWWWWYHPWWSHAYKPPVHSTLVTMSHKQAAFKSQSWSTMFIIICFATEISTVTPVITKKDGLISPF